MDGERSIVEYYAEHERYKCGYCGSADTNYSHGMWAHSLTVQDYEDLLNRGWRRSGKYTYKPTMDQTCCPQYTIRCEALNFQLRKSHKKVLKRVNKYLIHGIKSGGDGEEATPGDPEKPCVGGDGEEATPGDPEKPCVGGDGEEATPGDTEKPSRDLHTDPQTADSGAQLPQSSGATQSAGSHKHVPVAGAGANPSKPKCKKAKLLRRERKLAKTASRDDIPIKPADTGQPKSGEGKAGDTKTLDDYLSEPDKADTCAHKLEIRLVRTYPKSVEFEGSLKESYDIYHRYQIDVHKDPPDKPSMKQYTRFLVDSPLEPKQIEGGLPMGYGSFHQQYILDGKVICVGVIDILPSLVSSKYLYYDPDYHFLSLGTYSALREIQLVRDLNKYSADMIYYYMGFYLHSCPKMKYKGQYYPSFLLCPETNTWHPIEKCNPLLDKNNFSRFADKETEDPDGSADVNDTLVLHARQAMRYEIYQTIKAALAALRRGRSDVDEVTEYTGLVGKTCAARMLLFRK